MHSQACNDMSEARLLCDIAMYNVLASKIQRTEALALEIKSELANGTIYQLIKIIDTDKHVYIGSLVSK